MLDAFNLFLNALMKKYYSIEEVYEAFYMRPSTIQDPQPGKADCHRAPKPTGELWLQQQCVIVDLLVLLLNN